MKRLLLLFLCTSLTYTTYSQATCAGALTLTPGVQQCGDSAGQPGDFDGGGGAPTNPCNTNYNDDEYWFEYTAVATGENLTLTLSSIVDQWAGLYVIDDCPAGAPTCIASGENGGSTADISFSTGALVGGTSYKIFIANWGTPNSTAFCLDAVVTPPSNCMITAITAGTQSPCNPVDNTYTQDVTVTFADPPGTGMLNVNGQLFAIGASPQTVTLTGLSSDGNDVDVTAVFTDDALCTLSSAALFTAPAACQLGSTCMSAEPLTVGVQQCGSSVGFAGDFPNGGGAPNNPCNTNYNDDEYWFSYTPAASGITLQLDVTMLTDTWAGIFVLDDCPVNGPSCVASAENTGNTNDLNLTAAVTMGTNYKIVITNYGTPDNTSFCLDAIELTCTAPTVSIPADPIDNTNCPATVDVDISIDDLGNSAMVTVSAEDDMGNPAGTGGVTGLGVFTITNVPVPQTSWTILIAHETDPSCDVTLGPFLLNCPPLNDNACDAEALVVNDPQVPGNNAYSTVETNEADGSCWTSTTTGNTVWYSFVSPGSGMVEVTTDFATGLTDSQASLYEVTDCSDLTTATEVGCSEDDGLTGNGWMAVIETSGAPLTGGNMYYVQVDGYSSQVGDFEIQVNELPPTNDDCATAAVLAMNTTGSLINQYFQSAAASGMGPEVCDAAATPTPGDVWYSINTDADGGNLIVIVEPGPNSDIVVAIYDACGSPIPEQCVDLGGNGGIETINFLALLKGKDHATTRDADYFVRVYEKVASGEPFEIGAQGEALPIVLGSFEAKAEKRGNNVQWSTLSEINSDYVEVQSSPNGSTRWESIGRVATQGESSSRVDYELFDYNPYEVTYYRLNAVDKDGKSEFSGTINVRRSDVLGKMVISPNPTQNAITVQTSSATEEAGTVRLVDMTGKLVKSVTVNLRKGLNTINLDLNELQAGLYMFSLQTEDGYQVEKIVKQ